MNISDNDLFCNENFDDIMKQINNYNYNNENINKYNYNNENINNYNYNNENVRSKSLVAPNAPFRPIKIKRKKFPKSKSIIISLYNKIIFNKINRILLPINLNQILY